MLSFKPAFSLSCFTFIKRLFSSSSLYAIRVVSLAYLRLMIFLLVILIPACASSSLAFCIMYSAYKLNKQGDYIQPWCIPFPNMPANLENSERDRNTRPPFLSPEKPVCRSRRYRTRHEQQASLKLGKEHVKAVYCHPAYLTYMQSTS